MSAASIAAEVEGVGGQPVSAQTIRPTRHQIGLHGCCPRRKPLLKMTHKKARKQFAEDKQTKDVDYWNHVLWSDETKINLFGSDGVKRVWWQPGEEYKDKCVLPTVKHGGGSVMVWGCMSAASTVSYSSLREPWMPTCTVTYWSRAGYPPFGDKILTLWAQFGHFHLGVYSLLWPAGCVLSYFEGTANLHCYTSCTLTTLHCSKVSFLQCCHMKRYKIFTKMWEVYSLLWDTYIYIYTHTHTHTHIQLWSELLAPLVNMIKEGSENKPALLILLIFFFYHKNITFHWTKTIEMGENLIMK